MLPDSRSQTDGGLYESFPALHAVDEICDRAGEHVGRLHVGEVTHAGQDLEGAAGDLLMEPAGIVRGGGRIEVGTYHQRRGFDGGYLVPEIAGGDGGASADVADG